VAQHHSDFLQAIDNIRSVGKGILNLENKEFDHVFYEFRTRMKELDRRLGSVSVQGFDDAVTVFRLLDSFDNLITHPIVADELEKLAALIGSLYTTSWKCSRILLTIASNYLLVPICLPLLER